MRHRVTIRLMQERDILRTDTHDSRRTLSFLRADLDEVIPCLTIHDNHDMDFLAQIARATDKRTTAQNLVVGMGGYDQKRTPARYLRGFARPEEIIILNGKNNRGFDDIL